MGVWVHGVEAILNHFHYIKWWSLELDSCCAFFRFGPVILKFCWFFFSWSKYKTNRKLATCSIHTDFFTLFMLWWKRWKNEQRIALSSGFNNIISNLILPEKLFIFTQTCRYFFCVIYYARQMYKNREKNWHPFRWMFRTQLKKQPSHTVVVNMEQNACLWQSHGA